MKTQFITDDKGKKVGVILSLEQYNQIMNELEELESVKAFDRAIAKKEETILLREAIKQRRKKHDQI